MPAGIIKIQSISHADGAERIGRNPTIALECLAAKRDLMLHETAAYFIEHVTVDTKRQMDLIIGGPLHQIQRQARMDSHHLKRTRPTFVPKAKDVAVKTHGLCAITHSKNGVVKRNHGVGLWKALGPAL